MSARLRRKKGGGEGWGGGGGTTHDRSTQGDARAHLEPAEGKVKYLAADVVKVAVQEAQRAELLPEPRRLVVERLNAQLVAQPLALRRPAREADDAAALQPGDLAHERANCAGSAGNDHELAGLGPADVEKTPIGRLAGHAQRAEVERGRDRGRDRELGQVLGRQGRVLLPA